MGGGESVGWVDSRRQIITSIRTQTVVLFLNQARA